MFTISITGQESTILRRPPGFWSLTRGLVGIATLLSWTSAGAGAIASSPLTVETAVCSVVWKSSYEPSRAIAPANPIESLPYLPALCTSQIMSRAEIRDGVRSLLALGWRAVNTSHQTTMVGTSKDGAAELLISAIFTLERERRDDRYTR